jgi:hypothetical protein
MRGKGTRNLSEVAMGLGVSKESTHTITSAVERLAVLAKATGNRTYSQIVFQANDGATTTHSNWAVTTIATLGALVRRRGHIAQKRAMRGMRQSSCAQG